jgi:hypothetical protein
MSRLPNSTFVLSIDVINSIKTHCWGNIGEFYRRHKEQLEMSQATFYNAMQGSYCTQKTYDKIMMAVDSNTINPVTKSIDEWDIKRIYIRDLLDKCDKLLDNFSPESVNALKIFLKTHRRKLEETN